jgi:putative sigma-54 modulation protein
MNNFISAVGFTFEDDQEDLIGKKLARVQYAEDLIVDLHLRVKLDRKFIFECTVRFRWGGAAHVSVEDYEFAAGLNRLIDTLDLKIKKEKDKAQEKRNT